MANTIKLSPKHGLNPTICTCFFCGKEKNEIALVGKLNKNDDEAPHNMVIDYNPCDECKENMKKGVALIAVTKDEPKDKRPPIQITPDFNLYPTGDWCVVTMDAAKRLLSDEPENVIESSLATHKLLVPDILVNKIMQQTKDDNKPDAPANA